MITAQAAEVAWMLIALAASAVAGTGAACIGSPEPAAPGQTERPEQRRRAPAGIDILPYFLQSDKREEWTLGGTDVLPASDPEGSDARTVVETKFSNPCFYEVYKLTPGALQLRYEVYRPGGSEGEGNWVRRFEEIGGEGSAPGSTWMRRRMVPGERVTTRCRIDRSVYDCATHSYVHDPAGSLSELTIVISVVRTAVRWPKGDESGFGIRRVLRLVSDWHPRGQVIETYDYARGRGLVGWRWLERIATLPRDETLGRPGLFRCMDGSGLVEVEAPRRADGRPAVYRCDPKTGAREGRLEVVQMDSAFQPGAGKTWYVVFRDLNKEGPLVRKQERVPASYRLPEWKARPGASIGDLPYVHTHPPSPAG